MADYTEHYSLKKPLATEFYDVADQNGNMDLIDAALAAQNIKNLVEKPTLDAADSLAVVDSADGGKTKRVLWSAVKSLLDKVFVPLARKVNGKALSADVTLSAADVGAAAASHNHSAANITSGTLPIARGGTGKTTAADALAALGGLSKAGGTMTGYLSYTMGGYTSTPISVMAGNENGHLLRIQAGGDTILASGEAGTSIQSALGIAGTSETMHIAADSTISLHTNCQTIADRKTVTIDKTGKITAPGGFSGTLPVANVSGTLPVNKGGTGATTAAAALTALGAAAASHNHSAANITSGTLAVARGGTGQTTVQALRNSMGLGNTTGALPIANGGTGKTTAADARAALGAAAASHGTHVSYSTTAPVMDGTAAVGTAATVARSDHRHPVDTSRAAASHNHSAANITSGTVSAARLPVASSSASGIVSTGAQTFKGKKTFADGVEISNLKVKEPFSISNSSGKSVYKITTTTQRNSLQETTIPFFTLMLGKTDDTDTGVMNGEIRVYGNKGGYNSILGANNFNGNSYTNTLPNGNGQLALTSQIYSSVSQVYSDMAAAYQEGVNEA